MPLSFCSAAAAARAQAPAYIVVDVGAGTVIGQRDADKLWFPASVTKLMTAYLTFEALKTGRLKLTSPVTVSANALAEPPSKMGFKVGTVMNRRQCPEDDDRPVGERHRRGDRRDGRRQRGAFRRQLMNAEARRLGMNSTTSAIPTACPHDRPAYDGARPRRARPGDLDASSRSIATISTIPAIKAGRKVLTLAELRSSSATAAPTA